jgi:hypothetical protein
MENFSKLHGTVKGIILGHLVVHGSITEKEAFSRYGITCTAQRIHDLRKMGFCIRSEQIKFTNRHGHTSYYVRYRLIGFEEKAA